MLEHPDGHVIVTELGTGRRRVTVELADASAFMPVGTFETEYPVELIEAILELRGPAMIGYSILRAEDSSSLTDNLRGYVVAYIDERELEGERLLDFGCGSGSSTVALAGLFPRTQIVAIDLDVRNVTVARLRADHHGLANVAFDVSPGPLDLPPDLGTFDFICLSAVYEHLLPVERPVLMRSLWDVLRAGGVLFLNQTPHRYFPLEYHTTGLPFVNYLPDRLALLAARRFSQRVGRDVSWDELLRSGVRGATEGEILRHLPSSGPGAARLLWPCLDGLEDQVDLWYSLSMAKRPRAFKRVLRRVFKLVSTVSRSSFVPDLNLAVRKS